MIAKISIPGLIDKRIHLKHIPVIEMLKLSHMRFFKLVSICNFSTFRMWINMLQNKYQVNCSWLGFMVIPLPLLLDVLLVL